MTNEELALYLPDNPTEADVLELLVNTEEQSNAESTTTSA